MTSVPIVHRTARAHPEALTRISCKATQPRSSAVAHPSSAAVRAGCENKRLHNLVRGQLCTKLYLVLQEGLRLKTSKIKPHVWQVRAIRCCWAVWAL